MPIKIYDALVKNFNLDNICATEIMGASYPHGGHHMGIFVKLKCSECEVAREINLGSDVKDIICPVCGRRIANLLKEEFGEIQSVLKKQRMISIIALISFALAIVFGCLWVTDGVWVSGKALDASGKFVDASTAIEVNAGMLAATVVCALTALVLGIIGSWKRFVVEF